MSAHLCAPCPQCGVASTVAMTEDEHDRWTRRYETGEKVQHIFPTWSAGHRELLLTGIHPECWSAMFGPEE